MNESTRGTAAWSLQQLRSGILSYFLNDLRRLEAVGFEQCPDMCKRIKVAFDEVNKILSGIPNISNSQGDLKELFVRFSNEYARWNDHEGASAATRRNHERNMRALRGDVANVSRSGSVEPLDGFSKQHAATIVGIFWNLRHDIQRLAETMPCGDGNPLENLGLALQNYRRNLKRSPDWLGLAPLYPYWQVAVTGQAGAMLA